MTVLFVPQDGRTTSQNLLTGTLTGGEVQDIVSPGNAAEGNSYQISLDTLAAFFGAFPFLNTEVIFTGATSIAPYSVKTTDTRILFKKTLVSASFAVCPLAASMEYGQTVLFKDASGNADTNPIEVTFTNGELCDGQPFLTISQPYQWFYITPTPGGGSWYVS